ncbi:MAG: CPBP family intramembrane glutamic endopeptidase [Lachnospiraceae bacterium]
MPQRSMGSQIWRIAGPLVIQYLISGFIGVCAGVYLLGGHFTELMAAASGSTSAEQATKLSAELSAKMVEEAMKYSTEITMVTALCTIPIMLWLFYRDVKKDRAVGIIRAKQAPLWQYAGIVVLGMVACIALNNLMTLSNIAFLSETYQKVNNGFYSSKWIIQVLGLGLIAPIAEELIYRGLLYKRLKETSSRGMAMFYSALIFGLYHGNIVQAIYGFVLGLAFAYLYEQYGSIKAPIIAHVIVNLTSVVLTNTGGYRWIFATPLRMGIVTVICATIAAAVFMLIKKIDNGNIPEIKNQTV